MTSFILFAALLVVAVIALLLPPLLRAPKPSAGADHREANLAIFRDQLAELERERANGALDLADFEQAQNELQRRLLDEVEAEPAAAPPDTRPGSRKTALALLIVVPLAAAVGYGLSTTLSVAVAHTEMKLFDAVSCVPAWVPPALM